MVGQHMSEGSAVMLEELFATLGSQEVLTALFGNAMYPMKGIPCETALKELLGAAEVRRAAVAAAAAPPVAK